MLCERQRMTHGGRTKLESTARRFQYTPSQSRIYRHVFYFQHSFRDKDRNASFKRTHNSNRAFEIVPKRQTVVTGTHKSWTYTSTIFSQTPETGSRHKTSTQVCTWSLSSSALWKSFSPSLYPDLLPFLPPSLPPSECRATGHVELILEIGVTVGVAEKSEETYCRCLCER